MQTPPKGVFLFLRRPLEACLQKADKKAKKILVQQGVCVLIAGLDKGDGEQSEHSPFSL